jgi:hypothetical protein
MPNTFRPAFCCLLVVAGSAASGLAARAADAPTNAEQALNQCLADLNSDRFDIRGRGAEKLQALAKDKATQPALAVALERLLLAPDTSYEVRALCEPVLSQLPAPAADSIPQITPTEIDRLLSDVDGASYGQRVGAAMRLAWIAKRNPQWAATVAEKLKQRLKDPQLPSDVRRQLTELRETAWVRWLASDPTTWPAATATDKDVQTWLNTLMSATATPLARECAERELTDLVIYESWAPKLKDQVGKCLENAELPPEAIERLTRLSDLCQPAMVAEIWEDRLNSTLQYLLVDVPQFPDHALRATHFSSINDTTAHCVSGNSLAPGDYPVGVAIPITHPQADYSENRMFQLVNLPNARRRLIYDLARRKTDSGQRLHELSERTTAWMAAQKRCLTEREIALLRQLDGDVVSQFAGPYLLSVDDRPKTEPEAFQFGGRASRHTLVCAVLVEIGTHDVLPSLVEAGRRGRLPPPTDELRFSVGWLAAFTIAERDPWPGLDDWLAGIIDISQPISTAGDPAPEVGATAAAMLLSRHGENLSDFGVAEVTDQELRGLGIPASRFTIPAARQQVLDWWKRRQEKLKTPDA